MRLSILTSVWAITLLLLMSTTASAANLLGRGVGDQQLVDMVKPLVETISLSEVTLVSLDRSMYQDSSIVIFKQTENRGFCYVFVYHKAGTATGSCNGTKNQFRVMP